MTEQRKAVLRTVRLDDDVWEAVKALPVSLNQYLSFALLAFEGETTSKPVKKLNKREAAIQELAAGDVVAQEAGRDDIDYSDLDSAPTLNVANLRGSTKAAAAATNKTVENWRSNRKPIPKHKDRPKG